MSKRFHQPLVLAVVVLFIAATGAMAATVTNPVVYPNWQSGNAAFECSQIGAYACAYKFDNDTSGNPSATVTCTGPLGENWSTTITISNSNGYIFDWTSSPQGISAVIVKAGTGANVWFYDPAAFSDTGLYGYQRKQISHVTFCWNGGDVPPEPQGRIDVFKFCDANANGFLDITDEYDESEFGLKGWQINFNLDPNNCSGMTDKDGNVNCTGLAPGTYEVSEELKPYFEHTATCVDGYCGVCSTTVTTPCNIDGDCPTGETCVFAPVNPASITITAAEAHSVDFGNVGLSTISGKKFSDLDADGNLDSGEPGVEGVKVTLSGVDVTGKPVSACAITDQDGNYSFGDLLPGSYKVEETVPAGAMPSTDTYCEFVIAVNTTTCAGSTKTCNFGNVCLGAGGGKTLGFWSNRNGEAQMKDAPNADGPELEMLKNLHLRNANGTNFDPTTYTQFRSWLLSANATNMAYMLSAQLAAMALNVEAEFVRENALVYAPGCGNTGVGDNFITITNLMGAANTSLGANGYTVAAGPVRTYQECLKNALDKANNNMNFVVPCPAGRASCP